MLRFNSSFLFVFLLAIIAINLHAQTPLKGTLAITYAVHNPKGHDPNLFPYPKYVDLYAKPYLFQVLGTLDNHAGYTLYDPKTDFTFFCRKDSTGISFVPAYISHSSCNCHSSVPTGRKDVILGLPAEEYKLGIGYDTLRYWSTMAYGINDTKQRGVKGIMLKFEHYAGDTVYTIHAIDIDTITLSNKFYEPGLNFSPITFETDEYAFDYCRYDESTIARRQDADDVDEIFFYVPQHDISKQPGYRPSKAFVRNVPMPPVTSVSITPGLATTWAELAAERMFVLVIDYEMVDPVPSYILDWLAEAAAKYPNVKMAVVSRSPKKQILKTINAYPVLATLPHFVVDSKYYLQFNGREPLSYVMVNSDQTIAFLKSGYDVHSKQELNSALQKLR